jgi:hypothetical protein
MTRSRIESVNRPIQSGSNLPMVHTGQGKSLPRGGCAVTAARPFCSRKKCHA